MWVGGVGGVAPAAGPAEGITGAAGFVKMADLGLPKPGAFGPCCGGALFLAKGLLRTDMV